MARFVWGKVAVQKRSVGPILEKSGFTREPKISQRVTLRVGRGAARPRGGAGHTPRVSGLPAALVERSDLHALLASGPSKDTDHTDPGRRIRAGEVVSKMASRKL